MIYARGFVVGFAFGMKNELIEIFPHESAFCSVSSIAKLLFKFPPYCLGNGPDLFWGEDGCTWMRGKGFHFLFAFVVCFHCRLIEICNNTRPPENPSRSRDVSFVLGLVV